MLKKRKTEPSRTVGQRGRLQRRRVGKTEPDGSTEFSISGNSPRCVHPPACRWTISPFSARDGPNRTYAPAAATSAENPGYAFGGCSCNPKIQSATPSRLQWRCATVNHTPRTRLTDLPATQRRAGGQFTRGHGDSAND